MSEKIERLVERLHIKQRQLLNLKKHVDELEDELQEAIENEDFKCSCGKTHKRYDRNKNSIFNYNYHSNNKLS